MSHITDVKLKVKDLDALEAAGTLLGFDLRRGQKTHKWYGRFMGDSTGYGNRDPKTFGQCEHALRLNDHGAGDYEIGVAKAQDGDGFDLLYDSWGPGQRLELKAGSQLTALRREYAAAVATKKAQATLGRKGFTIQRENLANGAIRLKLRKR